MFPKFKTTWVENWTLYHKLQMQIIHSSDFGKKIPITAQQA